MNDTRLPRKLSTNTSGYPGVTRRSDNGKYVARVKVGKNKYKIVGYGVTAKEAYEHIVNWYNK